MPLKALELLLIVEDDADLRRLLAEFFLTEGFNVRTAEHGIEALRFLENRTPAAVVLDLGLPYLDGIGVLQVMRDRPETKGTPVIVITGTGLRESSLAAFGVRLVRKPFEPERLLAALTEVMT
jgi:two-component system chemotaxis response regulator CheY